MTTIQAYTPISKGTGLEIEAKKASAEMVQRMKTRASKFEEPSAAGRADQIAKQRAVKVHTVYRVDGKIVAVHQANGWTTSSNSNSGIRNIPGQGDADEVGRAKGLSGDALNNFVADQITANLKARYGSALEVESYDNPSTAPTSGEVRDKMFGITQQQGSLSATTSRIAMNTEYWAKLLDAYR